MLVDNQWNYFLCGKRYFKELFSDFFQFDTKK